MYVEVHCRAIDHIIHKGKVGEVYNAGGQNKIKNIDIVSRLGEYKYYDMDAVIASALELCKREL